MSLFKNYKFGQAGVNVDASPAHHGPDELLQAQNAIRDPLGVGGGLKNRPGLTKFNASGLGGSVLGGMGGSPVVPIDARTLYLAQQTGGGAENWYSTSNLFGASAQATAIASWQDPTDYYANGAQVCRMGVFFNLQLFYAAAGYTVGTTSPTIRAFNGVDDREITRLIPATTKGITGMFAQKGVMYVLTLDSGTTDADYVGRCFRMTETGQLVQLGTAFTTGYVPTALAVQNGIVYVGLSRTTTTNEGAIYRINPLDETTWTLDLTCDADDYLITALQSFQGKLYATTKNGGAATKGKIKTRSVAGVWSTVDSTTNNSGSYEGLAEFSGALYASSKNYGAASSTAVIRKSTDGASWSTVYNAASTTGVGLLNVVGTRLFSMGGTGVLYSSDGSSYTSAAPAGGGNCGGAVGLLVRTGAATWSAPVASTSTSSSSSAASAVTVSVGLSNFNSFDDRKHGYYYAIGGAAGTVVDSFGMGTLTVQGTTNSDSNAETDSVYVRMQDAGAANQNFGLVCTLGQPVSTNKLPRIRFRIRTHSANQTEYIWWNGLFGQTAVSDTDTLTAAGIAFRYHHPVGSSADSGNWYICVHDGTSQVDTDTGVAVEGGTVIGSVYYDMVIEVTSTTSASWSITNGRTGVVTTGTIAISGSFGGSVLLGPGSWGTDVASSVKVAKLSRITMTWN
jgi:hypothetical protein